MFEFRFADKIINEEQAKEDEVMFKRLERKKKD